MIDPEDRCTSRNGSLRCVLRPHGIGDHVGFESETAASVPQWWDRTGVLIPPTVVVEPQKKQVDPTLVPFVFEGDPCESCKMFTMLRTGKCTTCQNCGASGGCG